MRKEWLGVLRSLRMSCYETLTLLLVGLSLLVFLIPGALAWLYGERDQKSCRLCSLNLDHSVPTQLWSRPPYLHLPQLRKAPWNPFLSWTTLEDLTILHLFLKLMRVAYGRRAEIPACSSLAPTASVAIYSSSLSYASYFCHLDSKSYSTLDHSLLNLQQQASFSLYYFTKHIARHRL